MTLKPQKYNLLTITGPTACGKTSLAVELCRRLDGEIISADSRQVYKDMDIGTGKDLNDYRNDDGSEVKHHLIDIREAGDKYNLFEFQKDFKSAYLDIVSRGKLPVMCGGTGLYVESVVKGYDMKEVPENTELREKLKDKTLEELAAILGSYIQMHNTTDIDSRKRAIRAIEIADYEKNHKTVKTEPINIRSLTVGIEIDREERRRRITKRLDDRIKDGLIDEVQNLLDRGISKEDLIYYGLEYKFVTLYCIGELSYVEMRRQLEIAIHQFATRQMTWFRGMEKRGCHIEWIDYNLPDNEKIENIVRLWNE